MRNEKYAIWPLVMAESPKLLHSSAMDLRTRLWGRYHVPQNVFLVVIEIGLYLTDTEQKKVGTFFETWCIFARFCQIWVTWQHLLIFRDKKCLGWIG